LSSPASPRQAGIAQSVFDGGIGSTRHKSPAT